ncbi:NitT/TauT family transport system substrate-binding protein [Anaerovibrio lipolyticus DSM 3074]|uniref:NitT/TauT family transport system substrate-binding protein n=2 Tax=Anaerovibrio lipolyticus TaxID=82374 RepID=A0A1M6E1P6_9FIRM|nr:MULTISPECIES: MetQ/NlpA family ABC transporter substrate-binding protein [Anaerovibrio]SHI79417.1 NitT/TauT family transport system substrate-binding protein [Anaerovibrio lipolyticus DSM 3074]
MKKYLLLAISLICVFAVMVSGCGNKQSDKELQAITVGVMPDIDSVPIIIAQEKGYFAEEGLKVNIQQFKSAMDRDAALQSGNLDGAISDLLAVAFAKSGGFDVKVTAYTDGDYKLIAGKNENVTSPKDLVGKDVAVSKNTIIEYVTDQISVSQSMKEDSINKVVIPQIPTRLEMLQNGKLAAATLPEPMGSIAVANGCKFVTDSEQLGINPGVMMFTAKCVDNKKAELQAFYRAYNKAVKYLNEHPQDEYMDLIIEKSGFPAIAKTALKLPKYREAGLPQEKDVVDCMKWMNSKGLIKQEFSYKDLVVDLFK